MKVKGGWIVLVWLCGVVPAAAQLGALVSPGPMSKPHASLEGLRNCQNCHEPGQRVTAAKCLACHKPIADRIAMKKGVHRAVSDDCIACHVEHVGVGGELRPFDTRGFDHARDAGYPLDGRHAPLAARCDSCHKTRSYLSVATTCQGCHADPHQGKLGPTCETCHSTARSFKETSAAFDHTKTAFPLVGAHRTVTCQTCHPNQQYKGLSFGTCAACHKDPHRAAFGGSCAGCHTNDTWRTRTVEHAKTSFPLIGLHGTVDCARCHRGRPMQETLTFSSCASCHADVHKGSFKQDCRECHSETGFGKAPFDHTATAFPLTDEHAGLACVKCHKTVTSLPSPPSSRSVDFRGLQTRCASCHEDVHRGELGTSCETCHSSRTFEVTSFTHPRFAEFFDGQHRGLACETCHKPSPVTRPVRTGQSLSATTFKNLATTCETCHQDVHAGQFTSTCQTCHSVSAAKFTAVGFSHDATRFKLEGLHATVECVACHKADATAPASGASTARRFAGVSTACSACHTDRHLGQLGAACESCHSEHDKAFRIGRYVHRGSPSRDFFVGKHAEATCEACHRRETARFPAGTGTAVRFKVSGECTSCHTDIHQGALGPGCANCHRPIDEQARLERPAPSLGLRSSITFVGARLW